DVIVLRLPFVHDVMTEHELVLRDAHADLFGELAPRRLSGGLGWTDVPTRETVVVVIRVPHEHHAPAVPDGDARAMRLGMPHRPTAAHHQVRALVPELIEAIERGHRPDRAKANGRLSS